MASRCWDTCRPGNKHAKNRGRAPEESGILGRNALDALARWRIRVILARCAMEWTRCSAWCCAHRWPGSRSLHRDRGMGRRPRRRAAGWVPTRLPWTPPLGMGQSSSPRPGSRTGGSRLRSTAMALHSPWARAACQEAADGPPLPLHRSRTRPRRGRNKTCDVAMLPSLLDELCELEDAVITAYMGPTRIVVRPAYLRCSQPPILYS